MVREGEVLGLDQDLRRVLVAPFSGVIRLLVIGEPEMRVNFDISLYRVRGNDDALVNAIWDGVASDAIDRS